MMMSFFIHSRAAVAALLLSSPFLSVSAADSLPPEALYWISDSTLNYYVASETITQKEADALEAVMDDIHWENLAQMRKYRAERLALEEALTDKAGLTAAQARALFPLGGMKSVGHASIYDPSFSPSAYLAAYVKNGMISEKQAALMTPLMTAFQKRFSWLSRTYGKARWNQVALAARKAGVTKATLRDMQTYTHNHDRGIGAEVLRETPLPDLTNSQARTLRLFAKQVHWENRSEIAARQKARAAFIDDMTRKANLTALQANALFPHRASDTGASYHHSLFFDPSFSLTAYIHHIAAMKIVTDDQAALLIPAMESFKASGLAARRAYRERIGREIMDTARKTGLTPGQVTRFLKENIPRLDPLS